MSMPIIPPFAIRAGYQNSQFATGTYVQAGSQVFSHLVTPPTSGTAAETASDADAVAAGFSAYSAANEVQLITIVGSPSAGTFKLEWGDAVTTALNWNATAAQVQSALDALTSAPAGTGGTNEVQLVTIGGGATAGTFTLTYSGQTTATIPFGSTAAVVQTALRALSNVGASQVAVTGATGGPYTVTFTGTLATTDVAAITGNAGGLTGGTPTVVITTPTPGVAKTLSIAVTGGTGGPYTVTFANVLAGKPIDVIAPTAVALTGGTLPHITVSTTTQGRGAFVNGALANAHQQGDFMVNFYDSASGNHF